MFQEYTFCQMGKSTHRAKLHFLAKELRKVSEKRGLEAIFTKYMYIFAPSKCYVLILCLMSHMLGFPMPTFFQFVMGVITIINFLGKEITNMKIEMVRLVGANAAGPKSV